VGEFSVDITTHYRMAFASSCMSIPHPPQRALRFRLLSNLSGNTRFPRSTQSLSRQLRWGLDAGGSTILCRHVRDLQPGHACQHKEACLRPLLAPVGCRSLTTLTALRLISPYCPTLALNRMELPEGVRLSSFEPNSVHCPRGFAPIAQRTIITPA